MVRKALVVGISSYTHLPHLNLETFANNGEAIAKTLKNDCQFDLVKRLPEITGKEEEPIVVGKKTPVTKAELEQAIVELFKPEGRKPTTALLYFTGHGIVKKDGFPGGYLVTSDSDFQGNWGLSLKELRELLQKSEIPEQIIWLDSCYSDELINIDEANPGEKKNISRFFMAAATELAYGSGEYGVFTQAILNGLNPSVNDAERLDNLSLTTFILQELERSKFPQTPAYSNFGNVIKLRENYQNNRSNDSNEIKITICPYKGLEYFDCNDEDPKYFYGRESLTDTLLDRVRQNNFLTILGASGSGKSSVLRAGLLHQLKLGRKLAGSENWQIKIMLPGEHPLQNLALAWLNVDLSDIERATQLDEIETLLEKGAEGLCKLVRASSATKIILVIDQFEEAFTLCKKIAAREAFFQCLLEALEQTDHKLCLVLAMRIDFFGQCFEKEYSGLGEKIQAKENFIAIPPMTPEELKQAIVQPAKQVNLSVQPELVTQILKDVDGSSAILPLMQDTLTELWKRKIDNNLQLTEYTRLGGITGTLNKRATEIYHSLNRSEQNCARHIFLSLTTLGEGTEDTRRRVLKQDLITTQHNSQLIDTVVQKLADAKLIITSDKVEKNSQIGKQAEIDVAHEALIRNWVLLRKWLNESRDLLRQKRKIEDAAQEWQHRKKSKDILFSGKRLKEAMNFQKEQYEQFSLSFVAMSFLKASLKQQRINQFQGTAIVLPILLFGVYVSYSKARSAFLETARQNLTESAVRKGERIIQSIESLQTILANASDAAILKYGSVEEHQVFVAQLSQILPTNILCVQLNDLIAERVLATTCDKVPDLNNISWQAIQQSLVTTPDAVEVNLLLPSQGLARKSSSREQSSQNQLKLWLTAPVYDRNGRLRYALSVQSSILNQEIIVEPGSLEGYPIVINQDGVILAHPFSQRVGRNIQQMPDAKRLSSLLENAIAGEADFLHLFYLEKDGVALLAGYSAISSPVTQDNQQKWIILAVTPLDAALISIKDIRLVLVNYCLFISLGVIAFGKLKRN